MLNYLLFIPAHDFNTNNAPAQLVYSLSCQLKDIFNFSKSGILSKFYEKISLKSQYSENL